MRGLWQKLEGEDKGAYSPQMRVADKPYPIRVKTQLEGKGLPPTPRRPWSSWR